MLKVLGIGFVVLCVWAFIYNTLTCKGDMVTHQAGHQNYTTCE